MLRAVRAAQDPVWIADGYVSERWLPVSPVTGQLDAFRWQVPLAGVTSNQAIVIDAAFEEALLAPPAVALPATPPDGPTADLAAAPALPALQSTEGAAVPGGGASTADTVTPAASDGAEKVIPISPLLQRRLGAALAAPPPVIPIVRAPDDPGVDDSGGEFGDGADAPLGQPTSWRGYRPRRDS